MMKYITHPEFNPYCWVILTWKYKMEKPHLGPCDVILQCSCGLYYLPSEVLSDSMSGWLHEEANAQSQWENKLQPKQTEWTNMQSSKQVYPDSKLCLHIEMGLSWVEMFIDVNTSLAHFLYTYLSIFVIDTDLMQDVEVVSTSSCTYCRSITAIYPVLDSYSSQPGASNRQRLEAK